MAVAKINDNKTTITFIDDEGNQYFTSVRFMQGLLTGRSPTGFVELKMFPNKAPPGKWRKSPVWENGKTIPHEEYFGSGKREDVPTPDLMAPKARADKRKKESFGVDDNVW